MRVGTVGQNGKFNALWLISLSAGGRSKLPRKEDLTLFDQAYLAGSRCSRLLLPVPSLPSGNEAAAAFD